MATYRIVCWKCKSFDKPLRRLRDEKGKKTEVYACIDHFYLGLPEHQEGISRQRLLTRQDLEKAKKAREDEADKTLQFLKQQKKEIENEKQS